MSLITEWGRRDRGAPFHAGVQFLGAGDDRGAVAQAHREASAELRARFNRVTTVQLVRISSEGPANA